MTLWYWPDEVARMQEYRKQELLFHAMNPGLRIALGLPERTCEEICQSFIDSTLVGQAIDEWEDLVR